MRVFYIMSNPTILLGGMKKMKQTEKKIDKRIFEKTSEELQEYLRLMRKHNVVPARKGKGSFKRKKKNAREEDSE